MSRPQKKHKPLKGEFNDILGAVAMGSGKAKRAAKHAQKQHATAKPSEPHKGAK
jgi:hypothetical protein